MILTNHCSTKPPVANIATHAPPLSQSIQSLLLYNLQGPIFESCILKVGLRNISKQHTKKEKIVLKNTNFLCAKIQIPFFS